MLSAFTFEFYNSFKIFNNFIVPGSEERKIKSSLKSSADSIVYDLEDSVAFNRKGIAREMVFNTLEVSQCELINRRF